MAKKIIFTEEQEKEICDYYLNNHSLREACSFFNIKNKLVIKQVLANNQIALRSKADALILRNKKSQETFKQLYGEAVTNASQIPGTSDKVKLTKLERYGSETYNNIEKNKETCLKRYGVENAQQVEAFKEQAKQTRIKKYGVENFFQMPDVLQKAQILAHTPEATAKKIATNNKRFDSDWYMQTKDYLDKSYSTKKKNKSFNTSGPEENYYKLLCEKYGVNDVIRQYKDIRYPFACDFYIKSLDLFIELNLNWTHGPHRFDSTNTEDLALLNIWKEKAKHSGFYKSAVNTWAYRDVLKIKTAEKNKLNYITIY